MFNVTTMSAGLYNHRTFISYSGSNIHLQLVRSLSTHFSRRPSSTFSISLFNSSQKSRGIINSCYRVKNFYSRMLRRTSYSLESGMLMKSSSRSERQGVL